MMTIFNETGLSDSEGIERIVLMVLMLPILAVMLWDDTCSMVRSIVRKTNS